MMKKSSYWRDDVTEIYLKRKNIGKGLFKIKLIVTIITIQKDINILTAKLLYVILFILNFQSVFFPSS